jgi:predicted phosphodiesterase
VQKSDAEIEREARLFEFMDVPYPYVPLRHRWATRRDLDKLLVLADPHEPYGEKKVYDEVLKLHKDASTVIVAGDLGDYYSKSRFRKRRHESFDKELHAVFHRLEWLSENWERVRVEPGNHDNRPEKHIQDLLGVDPSLLVMTETNLLGWLASFFPNVKVVGTSLRGSKISLSHVWQCGDIIFTHAEISRQLAESAMRRLSEQLHRWTKMLSLKPYSVIAQGHLHQVMKKKDGSEWWMCLPMSSDPFSPGSEYVYEPRFAYSPPAVGYTVFYQHNGVTDMNRSNSTVLDL